jgi:simple sugar transport system permease protein
MLGSPVAMIVARDDIVRLLAAAATVIVVGAGLVLLAGANPLDAALGMIAGAFGERYEIAETLVSAVPLALVALGAAPALRAGIFTIGSEGQLVVGAIFATAAILALGHAPAAVLIPAGMIAGIIGGMLYALIPALLRAYLNVNEILSTLLLNYVAGYVVTWLLRTAMRTSATVATPRSDPLPPEAIVPKLMAGTRLHWGALAVIVAAVALAWWLRSARGAAYDVFATRPGIAARMGLTEKRAVIVTMLVAGAAAGLTGWLQVAGLTGTLYPSVGGGLGFTGVVVAILGGLRPSGILLAALFFGALVTGANGLQAGTGVPASISTVMQGVLLLVAALAFAKSRRQSAPPPEPEAAVAAAPPIGMVTQGESTP